MNSKEALEFLTEIWGQCYRCSKYDECHQLKEHETICENAKFIILKSLDRLEELESQIKDGTLSDGYHTFNDLYCQRMYLFATIVNQNKELAWKSLKHEDGKLCFDGDWFIVGIDTPRGSYTYHYETNYWSLFDCQELEVAKHWDGHTDKDVSRLLSLPSENSKLKEVIKIIITKGVNELFLKNTKTSDDYNKIIKQLEYFDELTQEEYELLKEVKENE